MSEIDLEIDGKLEAAARHVLELAEASDISIATAESCTGGLLASILTDLPGVSHRFECGFVVYSDDAKVALLGLDRGLLQREDAVSEAVARAMAERALDRSGAGVAAAITGFAGPGRDNEEGLVHVAVARCHAATRHRCHRFGPVGRDEVRGRAVRSALQMLREALAG